MYFSGLFCGFWFGLGLASVARYRFGKKISMLLKDGD